MDSADVQELLKTVVLLTTRQMAILDLIRQSGVSQEKIDEAMRAAKMRLQRVPRLTHLSSAAPQDIRGLAELLESIRWPENRP